MEVCGTHTMTIARHGIRELLPACIHLISGPGCPVCVTSGKWVIRRSFFPAERRAYRHLWRYDEGSGSISSLDREHAKGADIRIVTSTLEALALAGRYREKKIVFLGIGFETTVPTVAAALVEAEKCSLKNFFVLSAHKVMPPAMTALSRGKVRIHGYICPGHVSTIIGSRPYESLVRDFGIGCVIAGFEPVDILQAVLMLVRQIVKHNQQSRSSIPERLNRMGIQSKAMHGTGFMPSDAEWRGSAA